jgi:hypothetical protein
MRQEFCAYTAGLIDSEGCITVSTHRKSSTYVSVNPYVFITNTYLPILIKVQKVFGGKIQACTKRASYKKVVYILYFTGKYAVSFLSKIRKYIKLKNSQVDLLFKLRKLKNNTLNKNRGSNRYILRQPNENNNWHVVKAINPTIIKREQKILRQMRKLNKRGI